MRVFIVDLFPADQPLPTNLAEVLVRRDAIVFGERVRNDIRAKERISDLRNLVQELMENVEPETFERLHQRPTFIRLMGHAAPTKITRIVNQQEVGEPPFLDNDFSEQTVERHKRVGYEAANKSLASADSGAHASRRGSRDPLSGVRPVTGGQVPHDSLPRETHRERER